MKVLMLSKALVSGAYHKKLQLLVRSGIEMELIIPERWGNLTAEITSSSDYKIHILPCYFNGKNHFHFYRGIGKILKAFKPDIFHIDEEHYSFVTFLSAIQSQKNKTPFLFYTWQNINKKYPFPFSYFEKFIFRHASIGMAGNEEAKEILLKKGFKKEVDVIPQFGVDPELFKPSDPLLARQKTKFAPHDFVIGYFGRLVPEKGILDLLDAVHSLSGKCKLLIVGSGELKETILHFVQSNKMEKDVQLLNMVISTDVPEYLNACDCTVLPSLTRANWKEQFGRVIIESMACEVPVIGSDSGEIPNVIGFQELIFREGDVTSLTSRILMLMDNKESFLQIRKKSRDRVLNNFTYDHIVSATLKSYQKMLL